MTDSKQDAEFGEIDHNQPRKSSVWPKLRKLVVVGLVVAAVYGIHRRSTVGETPEAPPPAGWTELAPCSSLISLTDRKYLDLFDDQRAEFTDPIQAEQSKDPAGGITKGQWRYDASSRRYSITIGGNTTSYSLIAPEHLPICLMFGGEQGAANLNDSWVAKFDPGDQEAQDDRR